VKVGVAYHGVDLALEAERLGADAVWTAEYWGYDAHTPLAYLAAKTSTLRLGTAITQIGARTPAMLAMASMSLQSLSAGRFVLGLGVSGPQVMEGWHGVRFDAPLASTRETISIVRAVSSGSRLEHSGKVYQLPLPGGAGRAIRSLAPAVHIDLCGVAWATEPGVDRRAG
jgi:alkanesulfonate monooxygenase SsuD/methylene tetrahydromethanopterin reductase-like flavin-dependent oxidoreductase (luciferase family)